MTTVVCVKVDFIRPEYKNLEEWMRNSNNVYIGRSGVVFINGERFPKTVSKWANPFTVKEHGRDKCLELYKEYIRKLIEKEGINEIMKLKNKTLGCWCKPDKCHGDILVEILNELSGSAPPKTPPYF